MTIESSNYRPGEPLRSWADETLVASHDAVFALKMADAVDAMSRLLNHEALSVDDVLAFGRLNSYCVARWYEPMVTLLPDPAIDPATEQRVVSALKKHGPGPAD